MNGVRITRTAKQRLQKASRQPIEGYFGTFPDRERRQKWLRLNNRYRIHCTQQYFEDIDANAVNHPDLVGYIAASGPAHVIDAWSYLSRAVDAAFRGDTYSAIHLSYYAELRAAVALLACEGIGIFNNRHSVVDQNGQAHLLPQGQIWNSRQARWTNSYLGTHAVVWPVLQHWAGLKSAGDLLEQAVRPEGIALTDWLSTSGLAIPTRQVARRWLLCWGLDLSVFDDDHNARNLASYRPSAFRLAPELNVAALGEFIEDLWGLFEPGTARRFPVIERFLVRRLLRETGQTLPTAAVLESIALDSATAAEWANFLAKTDDPSPFRLAEQSSAVDNPRCHLQIISRATLLLYIATCAARRLLLNASYDTTTVEFWWKRHGVMRGFWGTGDCPSEPAELWANIEASLQDARQWRLEQAGGYTLSAFRRDLSVAVQDVTSLELAGLWGLLP